MESDVPQLCTWIAADPWHKELGNDFWLTGSPDCVFACRVDDNEGPVAFARLEDEGDTYRLHAQFAPPSEVPKRRVVNTTIEFIQMAVNLARTNGKQCLITESVSPKLVAFLKYLGFTEAEGRVNDYTLQVTG